jgi:hypothetical protein
VRRDHGGRRRLAGVRALDGPEVEDEPREGEDEHDAYRRIRDEAELLFTKEVNAQLSLALKIRKGLKT